jgi:hypothetical protein
MFHVAASAASTWKFMYQESDVNPLHQNGHIILIIICFSLLLLVFTLNTPDNIVL